MEKIDLKKQLKHLYNASAKECTLVEVPRMNHLMIDGQGDPNTAPEYMEAMEALFGVSYTLKFMLKAKAVVDYTVMCLEGLWWMDDMREFSMDRKDEWKWTALILQPDFITEAMFLEAVEQVKKKKNPKALDKLRFESFKEGLSAQIMHIGPFSAEGPTIEKLHSFIEAQGYVLSGKHHEIYLSDFRRTAPDRRKTIIRQPVQQV